MDILHKPLQKYRLLTKGIGYMLIVVGLFTGFLAPIEMYCFYLFSPGGRLYYEGFGFGCFMFGNIAAQIIGYLLIAVVFIPLGYGHIKLKKWIKEASIAVLYFWLIHGLPLIMIIFFILAATKDLSSFWAFCIVLLCMLIYLPIPILIIRFYKRKEMNTVLEDHENRRYQLNKLPILVLTLIFSFIFYMIVFFILIFFNCIIPVFGMLLNGLPGILLIDGVLASLSILIWGLYHLKRWSWWGAIILIGLLTSSFLYTFSCSSYQEILYAMNLPLYELNILMNIPAQGYHFAIFTGIPLLAEFILILLSRKQLNL